MSNQEAPYKKFIICDDCYTMRSLFSIRGVGSTGYKEFDLKQCFFCKKTPVSGWIQLLYGSCEIGRRFNNEIEFTELLKE